MAVPADRGTVVTRRRVPARLARWLIAAVAHPDGASDDEAPVPLTSEDLRDLAWAAEVHGVPGYAQRRAEREGLVDTGLTAAVHGAVARHQRSVVDLRATADALDTAGIPWLVVKGPVLADVYHGSPALRSSVDLDLLVAPADISAAVVALERAHFTMLDSNWPLLRRAGLREVHLSSPVGGAVDLHWSLVPPGVAMTGRPSVGTLLDRAVRMTVGGVSVPTLAWHDTVVHLAVHGASSGGHRLVWFADMRQALAAPERVDWELIEACARFWRSAPALYLMLVRARRTLGVEVPEPVLSRLVPSTSWRLAVGLADRLDPFERVGTARSPSRLVARACDGTVRASWGSALRRGIAASRRPPWGMAVGPPVDPGDPGSSLFRAGGDRARDDFLARVARTGHVD